MVSFLFFLDPAAFFESEFRFEYFLTILAVEVE